MLLGQGKVVDALRLAKSMAQHTVNDTLSARKYLEAAVKTDDPIVFYSVYSYFLERNNRLRGSPDFLKSLSFLFENIFKVIFNHFISQMNCAPSMLNITVCCFVNEHLLFFCARRSVANQTTQRQTIARRLYFFNYSSIKCIKSIMKIYLCKCKAIYNVTEEI